jgi:hypothetical protein
MDPQGTFTGSVTVALSGSPGFSMWISGRPQVGQLLTASFRQVTTPVDSWSYQWQRCDAVGSSCVDLALENASDHRATEADVGSTLRVKVTGTNAKGSWTAQSDPSPLIVGVPTLLMAYAPYLKYDSLETYRPDSAAEATDNYRRTDTEQYTNRLQNGDGTVLAVADPFYPADDLFLDYLGGKYPTGLGSNSADHLDEANGTEGVDAQRLHGLPAYKDYVYGHEWTDPVTGDKVLQYWMYYYYNPFTTAFLGKHEGDWEMIQVHLDHDGFPIDATYAQHDLASRCLWDRVEKTRDGHPIIYVAVGSHASYFSQGSNSIHGGAITD